MVEPLADRTAGQTAQQWLNNVARDTVLSPITNEQAMFVDGAPALIVLNGATISEKTENIYIVNGTKTLAVRFPHIQEGDVLQTCKRMLSTLRFSLR